MSDAGRLPATCRAHLRGWRDVSAAAASTLLAVLLLLTAACGGEATPSRPERPDVGAPQGRRGVGERTADTTSLISPTRRDSLIGSARGAGGIETMQAQCLACHGRAHDAAPGLVAVAAATCVACHANSHVAIQSFFAGNVPSVAVPADTMYLARVSCVGCHSGSTFTARGAVARATAFDAMCVSCHGPRFRGMLARWVGGMQWREAAVTAYVAQAEADPRLARGATQSRVRDARRAVGIVETAGAMHNIKGADQLLRAAMGSVASAYSRAGVLAPPPPRLGPDATRDACVGCHYGIETARSTVLGGTLDHFSHVVRADVSCTACHSDATYFTSRQAPDGSADRAVDPRHGKSRVTAASCDGCHHAPTNQLACTTCHAGDARLDSTRRVVMALALRPPEAPRSRNVDFQHAQHTTSECTQCHATARDVRAVVPCSQCHTDHHRERATGCVACHGTRLLATHSRDAHFTCANCHEREVFTRLLPDRTFCVSCHAKQSDHVPSRDECTTCHLRLTPDELRQRILSSAATAGSRND